MKKTISNIFFAAFAVIASLSSCTKEAQPASADENTSSPRVLVASFANSDVKSTLDSDGLTSKWAEYDVVKLTDGTNTQEFTLVSVTPGDNQAQITDGGAKFTVTVPSGWGETIYACYPSTAYSSISNEEVTITIPTSQDGSFAKANICTAKTTGSMLEFKNATALLKITPDSDTKGINIAISSGTPSSIVLTTSSTDAKYAAVPAGVKFSDITFTVVKNDNSWAQKTSAQSTAIERNKIYNLGALTSWGLAYDTSGSLWGEFTVNGSGKKVRFSKGSLRAKKVEDNWIWGFYDKQYECNSLNGSNSSRTAESTDTEIDLFTWGYNATNSVNPTTTSCESTFSDWGTVIGSGWSTLTKDEWVYLITTRGTGDTYRKVGVTVCDKTKCLVIAPDGNTTAIASSYDASAWATAEASGFVCLPAAGYRNGSGVYDVGDFGRYWSSSLYGSDSAYYLYFYSDSVGPENYDYRSYGRSVRLVCSVSN